MSPDRFGRWLEPLHKEMRSALYYMFELMLQLLLFSFGFVGFFALTCYMTLAFDCCPVRLPFTLGHFLVQLREGFSADFCEEAAARSSSKSSHKKQPRTQSLRAKVA